MNVWIELVVFLAFAVPITLFDLREYHIPDYLTLGGIAVFAALMALWEKVPFALVAGECAAGFGLFWLIRLFSKGRMGLGDAKYSALIAVAVGFAPWLIALFVASLTGLAAALILMRHSRMRRDEPLPFAPFLSVGALAAFVSRGLGM